MLNKLVSEKTSGQGSSPGLRIQPELNLDYPQSDITEISHDDVSGNYQMTTTFFGLYGVSSPLPGFYTEELLDDEWDEYSARKNFFDVIHNHLYPLLYQAWLKYKLSHNIVEFNNRKYAEIIFSLVGLSEAYRVEGKQYGYLLKYAGLLSQRTRSLAGLKTLLKDVVGDIGLDIRPCLKRMVPVVRKQRCLLGKQNATLGSDASIGKKVVDRVGKFNIEIGPVNAGQFAAFNRGSETVEIIRNLIEAYLVQPLEFSISLLLEPGTVKPARIGERESSILGSNTWLTMQTNTTITRVDLIDVKVITGDR